MRYVTLPLLVTATLAYPVLGHAQSAAIVWKADAKGRGASIWVDAGGNEIVKRAEIVVAVGARLWAVRQGRESIQVSTCSCAQKADPAESIDTKCWHTMRQQGSELVSLDGHAPLHVRIDHDLPKQAVGEFCRSIDVIAGLGPYLFLDIADDKYECLTHNSVEHEARLLDLRTTKPVTLLADMESKALAETLLPEALRALKRRRDEFAPELTMLVPTLDRKGRFKLKGQLTFGDCYACSDRLWDSYSVSARVDVPKAPRELTPLLNPPAFVAAALAKHRGGKFAGYSMVEAASPDVAAMLLTFRKQPVPRRVKVKCGGGDVW